MLDAGFYAILQVVVCLMIRKTVPLMNYVQVSKTIGFSSRVVDCLFNLIFTIYWRTKLDLLLIPYSLLFMEPNLYIKQFLVFTMIGVHVA